ncbi:MAG: D-aminoacyl-tRNA deacylase [Bacteroidota bacterium]|nr:D-aminoacyl-tRNA deacylase [Bacteroidota bacterium]MDP4231057.1 D-aminoacyl-tRNA deacylase [Bacteroidota bacterium]MDP4234853.1 D-aminoacyl-tRNA deacylase [Bacteroidota bacterium]
MRLLIQRVSHAKVTVGDATSGEISNGLVLFVGVGKGDTPDTCSEMASKVFRMRIFEDSNAKKNLDLSQVSGSVLIVSQFTLYADTRKGNRPNFTGAAPPEEAKKLYELFVDEMKKLLGENRVAEGVFGAMMDVQLINTGPVTIWVESC